jgi:hypothetical protein
MTMRKKLLLVALAAANLTCAGALMTAPPNSTLTLFANPLFVPADGGVSVLSAFVTEPIGTTVPDGTVVQFFTDLGRVDPREGKTKDGVARVNFISDARSGTATITAFSGGAVASGGGGGSGIAAASATTTVVVGGAQGLHLIVIADPSRITTSRSTHIIATVLDGVGNPVPNIGVIFTVPTTTEFMDSQGHPIFTDSNGRAEDVLRTRRTSPGSVTVTVQTLSGASGSVTVPILLE